MPTCRVRTFGRLGAYSMGPDQKPHLLPSWKRANSKVARSSTVSEVTVMGPLALFGKAPGTRTSCQSEWSLQISTELKYLAKEQTAISPRSSCGRGHCSPEITQQQGTRTKQGPTASFWVCKESSQKIPSNSNCARSWGGRAAFL